MACKVENDLMKAKMTKQTEQKKQQKHQMYASVARTAASAAIAQTPIQTQTIWIEGDRGLKEVVSILHAHIHNVVVTGTYKTELTRLLGKLDIDQPDDLPDNPPSHDLFKIQISDKLTQDQREQTLEIVRQSTQTPITSTHILYPTSSNNNSTNHKISRSNEDN